MRRSRTRRWVATLAALAAATMTLAVGGQPPAATAAAGDPAAPLLAWWKLDETSGTVAADSSGNGRHGTVTGTASWNNGDGFVFGGGSSGSGNAIRLPDNLTAGRSSLTVDFDVWVDPTLSGNWFMFNLGNQATFPNGTGYLFVTGKDSSSRFRATIAEAGFSSEQSAARSGALKAGVWKHVTYSITGGSPETPGHAELYEDGVLVASNTGITTSPALIGTPDGTSTRNFLGRSAYSGDQSFKGRLRDVRLYAGALTASEAADRAAGTVGAAVSADAAALTLGDTSAVVADLVLPTSGASGTTAISWASSAPDVVSASGTVNRPAYGEDPAAVALTATLTRGQTSATKEFALTVLPEELDDAGKAQEAVAAVTLVHPDDVRGNLTLPTAGLHVTSLSWTSSAPDVVTATGEVTRPAYGASAVAVTLTVTATRNGATASRDIVVQVQPSPAPADYDAYAFAYFAGESTDDGERIYFAASRGDDPLDYDRLNDGRPVLSSTLGEKGLRDPFLIRSPEGDRFYLLATDLKIFGGNNFGTAQQTGSKALMIWESTDLVHWSDQRMVKVSSDFAGNTWAPEAFYDEEAGEYVVYWASALYPTTDSAGRDINTSYQRMMYATTRDFVTFSEPQVWVDVKRGTGRGMIDATVVKDGGTYYRVIKDEASMTPRQERSTDLRATVTGSLPTTTSTPGWQLVKEKVGIGQPNPWGGTFTGGEGPTVFRDNDDPDRWYMLIDQPSYHGGQGYLAFRTDDIASGSWTSVPSADLPSSPRHGTVIPVTQAELDTLRAGLQPGLLITEVDDVAVTTREGSAPQLPASVRAQFGDGRVGTTAVEWEPVDPSVYAAPGSFQVQGTATRGSADDPIATVTVTDAHGPVVEVDSTPDGAAGWWRTTPATVNVSASDDTGVERIETSLDGGPWVAADGAETAIEVTGDGEHEVRARAVDVTGNVSTVQSGTVRVDTAQPVSRAAYDETRSVTIRAADATSGVDRIELRVGDGPWTTYDGSFVVQGQDQVTVEYRAVDVAGSVEQANRLVVPAAGASLVRTAVVAAAPEGPVKYGAAVPLSIKVTAVDGVPSGTVRVLSGGQELAAATPADGAARVVVDTRQLAGLGEHTVVVRYDGDETFAHDEDTLRLTLVSATSRTSLVVGELDREDRSAVARLRVVTDPEGLPVPRVRMRLLRGAKVVRDGWLRLSDDGRGRWHLSGLGRGTWTVSASTPGSQLVAASTAERRFRMR